MRAPIECEGAPRDLGLDQGRACGPALRARFAACSRWQRARLRLGWPPDRVARLARELERHFPHQAESLAGLARGAGVPDAWLALRLSQEAGGGAPLAGLAAAGPLLARGLDGEYLVRRSRPEGLFASVEITRPWLSCALLGVNERGLSVAGVAAMPVPGGGGAAPALLLAQDCLERFEALEAALEWCLGRPAAGPATLVLGDARGDVAGVEIGGAGRRVLRPEAGVLVCERRASGGDLAKLLRDAGSLDAAALGRRIGGAAVDVGGRRLVVDGAGFSP